MNVVILCGYLGSDPTVQDTRNGQPMCKMRLATHEHWTASDGERQSKTHWHNLRVFRPKIVTLCERYAKGDKLLVRGKLDIHEFYDDQERFQRRVNVIVSYVESAGSPDMVDTTDPLADEFFGDGSLPR